MAIVSGEDFRTNADSPGGRVIGFEELPRTDDGDPRRDDEKAVTWQLYTSGTTGLPKGAMLNSLNLFGLTGAFGVEIPEMPAGGRTLVAMPLYHLGGCGWALAALTIGSTAVVIREFNPAEVLDLFEQQHVEILSPRRLAIAACQTACWRRSTAWFRRGRPGQAHFIANLTSRRPTAVGGQPCQCAQARPYS